MRSLAIRMGASSLLAGVMLATVAAEPFPAPPVKTGLWAIKSSARDADGRDVAPPEQAAFARMSPEARARMAEMMKGRGVAMPDADGTTKVCLTKEMFDSGTWQQAAADSGCTTAYGSRTGSTWKWHTSCTRMQSESDGEVVFNSPESYRTTLTTTMVMRGQKNTTTRVVDSRWLSASCGDVKPLTPPPAVGR